MQPADTNLGGAPSRFPETSLGMVGRFRRAGPEEFRSGMESLCRRYWRPIFLYSRAAWAKTHEEAKDLTQAFFLWLLEGDALKRFDPERGGFRPYLKVLLRRFAGQQELALGRLKRGGGARVLSLDHEDLALKDLLPDPRAADPEQVFEQAWFSELLTQAADRVRERRRAQGDGRPFEVYEAYAFGQEAERPSYAALAERFGLKEAEVRKHLFVIREEIRAEVRAELARMTVDDRELDDEWKLLFG